MYVINSLDVYEECGAFIEGFAPSCPANCTETLEYFVDVMDNCLVTYLSNNVPFFNLSTTLFYDCGVSVPTAMPVTTPTATPTDSGATVGVSVALLLAALAIAAGLK